MTYFGIDVLEGYFSNCRALYLTNIFFKPWAPPSQRPAGFRFPIKGRMAKE